MRRICIGLLAVFATAYVNAQSHIGPWTVSDMSDGSGSFAATANESGGLFGKYCYGSTSNCMWLMANDITCIESSEYTVLINSESGAASTKIFCRPVQGVNRYIFSNHSLIDDAVLSGQRIGFAFPMKDGRFQVSRFDVTQAAEALRMLNAAMRRPPQKKTPSTKDITL